MAKQTTKTTKKFDPKVRYVPDYVQRAIAGAKGPKAHPRPFLFDVRTFQIDTKEDGTKLNTYLLFGGVPSKKLHAKLEDAGFKVRRRARSWTNKNDEVIDVADRDNECYAVYYTLEPITKDQAQIIARLYLATAKVAETGKGFLAPNWATVEKTWGDKEDWLTVCTVEPEDDSAAAPAPEADDDALDIEDIDDMI